MSGMAVVTELVDHLGMIKLLDGEIGPIKVRDRGFTGGEAPRIFGRRNPQPSISSSRCVGSLHSSATDGIPRTTRSSPAPTERSSRHAEHEDLTRPVTGYRVINIEAQLNSTTSLLHWTRH